MSFITGELARLRQDELRQSCAASHRAAERRAPRGGHFDRARTTIGRMLVRLGERIETPARTAATSR